MEHKIEITKDGSATLKLPNGEYYHSLHGAITESQHVFIKHGLSYFLQQSGSTKLSVFEMGLGSGLNALLSQLYAEKHAVEIDYTAVELYPLDSSLAHSLNFQEPLQLEDGNEKLEKILATKSGQQTKLSQALTLTVWHTAMVDFTSPQLFDIIYYDAFAPNAQSELWTIEVFEKLYNMLNKNGVLTTYCAKGQVKRDLKAAGFTIESLPGPPGKREMTRAVKI